VPRTVSTYFQASVATPDRRWIKFNAWLDDPFPDYDNESVFAENGEPQQRRGAPSGLSFSAHPTAHLSPQPLRHIQRQFRRRPTPPGNIFPGK
jgi:hypothetical protein